MHSAAQNVGQTDRRSSICWTKKCFATTTEEQKQKPLTERNALSTQKATKSKLKCFNDYLKQKGIGNKSMITDANLPAQLLVFYCDLRKEDGEIYKISSLKCMRAGLNHHFKDTRGIDSVSDLRFKRVNDIFDRVKVDEKKKGKGTTVSKKAIRTNDMEVISEYFSYSHHLKPDPKRLQEFAIFNTIYYFCCRGRENLHSMQKTHFRIDWDYQKDCKFVVQNVDELDKNHRENYPDATNKGRMYEIKGKYPLKCTNQPPPLQKLDLFAKVTADWQFPISSQYSVFSCFLQDLPCVQLLHMSSTWWNWATRTTGSGKNQRRVTWDTQIKNGTVPNL